MKLNMLTIKQKILLTVTFAVLLSTVLVGVLSQRSAKEVVEQRMLTSELPNTLQSVRNKVEMDISVLMNAAEQLANSKMLKQWLVEGRPADTEALVIEQLNDIKRQYNLAQASYADRETAAYYTQDGFLRLLTPDQDGWFFGYRDSGQERMLNVFTEANGEVKLFINYQQPNDRGLVGLAKSLDDMVRLLGSFKIEDTGFVYLVDAKGQVKLHQNTSEIGRSSLTSLYQEANTSQLLNRSDFSLIKTDIDGESTLVASSYIPSMDWYLIAQVPESEVFALLEESAYQILIWTLLIAAAFIGLSIFVAGSVSQPIAKVADMLQDIGQGEGDLRQRLPVEGQDELAQLAKGFNSFIEKIQHSIIEVTDTSVQLSEAATNVANQAQQTLDDSQLQKDQTMMVVTAINEMGATVHEIAGNAAQAADNAKDADNESSAGQVVVMRARDTINELSKDVEQVGNVIESLATHTTSIGSILDVIRAVSDQTNLLALNAAIEAARAGEAGRGFAVVAEEVRNLASRTAASTDEVQKMIDNLQAEAARAVQAMIQSRTRSQEGVAAVDEASHSLTEISQQIGAITDMNIQVAAATEEQSTVVEDINRNVTEISEITRRTTETSEAVAQASQSLNQLARRLDTLVAGFKV
ncbi:energy taxis-modulating methyl-accepting chemotaxis protein with Cache_1 sensory domain [Shewanella colwelliana]|uniref:Chemotaxis protein n=1 Tax=Shewanella colwelliana TaxID=23 RepID=A0A1E5IYK7_SHECO|nr:methyl-accepting chemotaxis protein [Shewanella colwelliana]MDX1281411.1 methyl-accepting chemotaxis protein [Shewanella colwelliana]OEG75586.1 chemotaxis protein [Shewanella colwelliana]GIU17101.1 energy taxis-modulating methyl-accepting chemotaxis protein with Cache_1 sensory domain [Shewanella colwelliana]GIU39336.1 energy taxis-modulating methyl-accepting chemotaxis protein with Cache_1 sensory domain [Shewanella colwelliana]